MSKLANEVKSFPARYFGLHFSEGCAEYAEPGKEPYKIFINEQTIRNMSSTFDGKPVYVEHVESVDLKNIQHEADGYVVKSFYNALDGKHWVEFIVITEEGKKAIQSGWSLSNAYLPKSRTIGGTWHGMEYQEEITSGEYEHLAIVPNPRYAESIILSPEEFKKYNESKEAELKRISNSKEKGEEKVKLNFFKRTKIENEIDLESTVVELPKSKKEMTIATLVNEMDKVVNMHGYANDEHMVKCGNEEMSVKELVKRHMDNESMKKQNEAEDDDQEEMENDADEATTVSEGMADVGDRGGDKSLDNEEEDGDEKKAKEDKKKNAIEKAKKLKNAGPRYEREPVQILDVSTDKVARGKALFGK